jgi:PTH2 family peptidyl-tRNA hydrolase
LLTYNDRWGKWDVALFASVFVSFVTGMAIAAALRGTRRRAAVQTLAAAAAGAASDSVKTALTEERIKMVLVVRKDLGMSTGKMSAQCAHAAVAVAELVLESSNDLWLGWYSNWRANGATKIALQCLDEVTLKTLKAEAVKARLPCYVISDAGRTQIAAGSKTVLAIGPAPVDVVDRITGHLSLL